jgi:type VI secretion system protein VasL
MKAAHPILHTYGMPRTFTMDAIRSLGDITHYRHVNDNDTVTQIPPDADLDSALYEKFGPIGEKLGFNWLATTGLGIGIALNQLGMQSLGLQMKKDPYWHHGNIVIFFQAQRCVMKKNHQNAPWIGGGGRDNPAPGIVYSCDYAAVKLFLVPSLNEESLKSSGEYQATFIQRIGTTGLEKLFPHNSNPTLDGLMTNAGSHSMAHKYLPYIHNQVLELADPVRPMGRKEMRDGFQRDMELAANSGNSNQDELERNRIFYQLQNMLSVSLDLTRKEVTGKNALIRFAEMTEEEVELSK